MCRPDTSRHLAELAYRDTGKHLVELAYRDTGRHLAELAYRMQVGFCRAHKASTQVIHTGRLLTNLIISQPLSAFDQRMPQSEFARDGQVALEPLFLESLTQG